MKETRQRGWLQDKNRDLLASGNLNLLRTSRQCRGSSERLCRVPFGDAKASSVDKDVVGVLVPTLVPPVLLGEACGWHI